MPRTSVTTDLLGAKVYDGVEPIENRKLSYFGLSQPGTIRAVFIKDGSLCLLVVDDKGQSAEIFPCCVSISAV